MSLARLQGRAPSARRIGTYTLWSHALRFHKASEDSSGKCDAYYTDNPQDFVLGALFEISAADKAPLDEAEGLGHGYDEKIVILSDTSGPEIEAITYYATAIDNSLKPYSWYKHHVLVGARESALPELYISIIEATESIEDPDHRRANIQRAIHG